MFKIINNNFKVTIKCKDFLQHLDDALENVPRRDMYYKDKIRGVGNNLLKYIFECSYEEDTDNILKYKIKIKASIAYLDFMLDRLHTKKYINEKVLYKLGMELIEINKLVTGWINSIVKNES